MHEWGCNGRKFFRKMQSKTLFFLVSTRLPTGVIWCNNEGVIGSGGVKRGKSWSAKGVKECKIEGVFFQRGGGIK